MRVADKLEISRNLSMVIPADRAVLVEAAAGIPELARLVEEHLDDYLRLFPEDHWREVHSGGLIAIQSSKGLTTASNIQRMLETTEKLKHLEAFPGFSTLLGIPRRCQSRRDLVRGFRRDLVCYSNGFFGVRVLSGNHRQRQAEASRFPVAHRLRRSLLRMQGRAD